MTFETPDASDATAEPRIGFATATLALLGEGATPGELAARLRDAGLEPAPHVADALLRDLVDLGLARVARTESDGPRFVRSTLGEEVAAASLASGAIRGGLDALERLRSDLLATVAHELRTPLTAIRTSSGLLLDPASEPTDEQRRQLLLAIERNADRMQRLVADLLDLARFREGRIALQRRRFDAAELAREAAATIAPLFAEAGQALVVHPPRHPRAVFGDRRRLEQALLNLLSNAQKFSPPGTTVDLEIVATDGQVAWVVRDAGVGIDAADRAQLFERFFVGRTDRTGAGRGTGLGLPIARAIAQAHGGEIEVESQPGVGSTFRLVVPLLGPDDDEP
jgi:signal transduction histidine kinase